ncbi:MAG: DegT/DnrJ/EryC1/StrS aminotransferase family protein [Burkholderiales bacterium]|nr:DegT/DnrJ/EryC1/StrS aminotransferase family protein [Burkholderiales bacterium]
MNYLPFARPTIDADSIAEVAETLASGWIASGAQVLAFENALSQYLGGRQVRALTSATAAMEVALQVAGVGPGDEVITSAQSFFSAPNMIVKVGAKPVFVDVDLATRNMDLSAAAAAITPRTKALLPTHFAGLPMDMEALYGLAEKHKLRVIEDAALAIGSAWQGKPIGSFGDLVSFSFHPNKNMTTIEGGALSVPNAAAASLVEKLRFHGIVRLADGSRDVDFPGGKFNLSDVSARLGIAQLKRLPAFNAKRRQLARHYFECLHTDPPCLLPARGDEGHSWNMFAVLLPLGELRMTRKQFIDAMHARGIGIGISYEALHLATLYRKLGYQEGDFPNAERIGRETVTLPLFPAMTLDDVERVCENVADILKEAKI